MTPQERLTMMARVLGGNVDTGIGADSFVSTGPMGSRTVLTTDERIITRAINALAEAMGLIDDGVNGFDARFTRVIGEELGVDEDDFEYLDGNLIKILADFKRHGGPGGSMPEPPADGVPRVRVLEVGETVGVWVPIPQMTIDQAQAIIDDIFNL